MSMSRRRLSQKLLSVVAFALVSINLSQSLLDEMQQLADKCKTNETMLDSFRLVFQTLDDPELDLLELPEPLKNDTDMVQDFTDTLREVIRTFHHAQVENGAK